MLRIWVPLLLLVAPCFAYSQVPLQLDAIFPVVHLNSDADGVVTAEHLSKIRNNALARISPSADPNPISNSSLADSTLKELALAIDQSREYEPIVSWLNRHQKLYRAFDAGDLEVASREGAKMLASEPALFGANSINHINTTSVVSHSLAVLALKADSGEKLASAVQLSESIRKRHLPGVFPLASFPGYVNCLQHIRDGNYQSALQSFQSSYFLSLSGFEHELLPSHCADHMLFVFMLAKTEKKRLAKFQQVRAEWAFGKATRIPPRHIVRYHSIRSSCLASLGETEAAIQSAETATQIAIENSNRIKDHIWESLFFLELTWRAANCPEKTTLFKRRFFGDQ